MSKTQFRGLAVLLSALSFSSLAFAQEITLERAQQVALQRVPGKVVEVERDRELGKDVIEVTVRTNDGAKFEVTIDAQDGTVLEVEQDD